MSAPTLSFGCSANIEAGNLVEFARRAEALGYDRIATGEHVQDGDRPRPTLLALPLMAAAAGATTRIRVMTGIVIAPLYHPVLLAKMVATVDHVSNGRLDFGIGISGQRDTRIEYDILGVPVETRGRRANEMLQVMQRLWTEQHVTHKGEFFQFEGATLLPQPVQKPYPPIWVAGRSEAAMKRAGTLGDGWFPYLLTVRRLKDSNEAVRRYGEAAGRDMSTYHFGVLQPTAIAEDPKEALALAVETVGRRYVTPQRSAEDIAKGLCVTGTPEDCVKGIQDRLDAGVRDFVFAFLARDEHGVHRQMETFAERVLPNFR
ncbi:MAG: LLM class flavin-dependent oxidoreductase [candidate division NC10 bacterium]|nr:LLM class flavin-dependent oxidoreductase [candidate division NC10 bacterium]